MTNSLKLFVLDCLVQTLRFYCQVFLTEADLAGGKYNRTETETDGDKLPMFQSEIRR